MTVDRKTFFDAVREPIFHGMTEAQVGGCSAIMDEAEKRALVVPFTAYILATAYWETAHTMQPIREIGLGRGRSYGAPDPETGRIYYGRGLVQLTWKANYAKFVKPCGVDLVANPNLALDLGIAVKILFEGMLQGMFTGKKLGDYFHGDVADWKDARRIINGVDQAKTIAGIAQKFNAALAASEAK